MIKTTLITCFLLMISFTAQAQYDRLYAFEKGSNLIGLNLGLSLGNDSRTVICGSYEYGLTKLFVDECVLGGGVFGGYYKNSYGAEVGRIYITGLRLNVHYQFVDRLDTYLGIDPNFNIRTFKQARDSSGFATYIHAGGRYYLTNWLGVFAEVSTGSFNTFSGGASIRF